jgi:hypothetical protein
MARCRKGLWSTIRSMWTGSHWLVRLLAEIDHAPRRKSGQQPPHVVACNRDTASRRPVIRMSQMEKDSAAAMAPARGHVPIEHQHHIIEPVGTKHRLMAGGKGKAHRPVIGRMTGRVAPAVHRSKRSESQPRERTAPKPVGAVITAKDLQPTHRACPVALALEMAEAATADRAGKTCVACHQPAAPG